MIAGIRRLGSVGKGARRISADGTAVGAEAPAAEPAAAERRASRRPFEACCETDRLIIRVLIRMGWRPGDLHAAIRRARRDGLQLEDAVLAVSSVERPRWTSALAAESGLPVLQDIDPARLILPSEDGATLLRRPWQEISVGYRLADGRYRRLVPDSVGCAYSLPEERRDEARLVSGPVLRRALIARLSPQMESEARNALFVSSPDLSARHMTNAWQAFAIGAIGVLVTVGLILAPALVLLAVHLFSSSFFLSCMILRLRALPHAGTRKPQVAPIDDPADLPVYTVLVALYREADMTGQLLAALGRLRWPHGKLEIRLICEADDRETIDAIHVLRPPANVEVLEVPPGELRTKPRALNFALQTCHGDYVCLFDAEDRPHPDQLIEAYRTFRASPPEIACLQAPLIVANGDDHWLAHQFAFEYTALFRGVLRYLSARGAMLPLGGTSNHFRREVLDRVGAWDPYNVTEDADLGIRMARAGYRSATIDAPTWEDAPTSFSDWLPQRTRWLKGWMVCWLVHNRHPLRLWRELGPRSFLVTQILIAGIPGAALLLPVMLSGFTWFILRLAWQPLAATPIDLLLHGLDFINMALCLLAYLRLGRQASGGGETGAAAGDAFAILLYWLLQSVAAWRAVTHLVTQKPHQWEKTNHLPTRAWRPPAYARRFDSRNASPPITISASASPMTSRSRPA